MSYFILSVMLVFVSSGVAWAQSNNVDVHIRAGERLAANRKFDDAISQYLLSLFANPDNELARNDLNQCLLSQGLEPQNLKLRLKRAAHYKKDGRLAEAAAEYGECAHLEASGENLYMWARALSAAGQAMRAKDVLARAMAATWSAHHARERAACDQLLNSL